MAYAGRFLLDTNLSPNALPVGYVPDAQQEERGKYEFKLVFSAMTCVVICILGIIAATRFNWLRLRVALSRGSDPRSGAASAQAAPQNGLNKKDLESLPRISYDSNRKSIATNSEICEEIESTEAVLECAICLTEYADGDEIRLLPQCGHKFHIQCIDKWLMSHSSCPSCRQILLAKCRNSESVSIWDDEEEDGDRSFTSNRVSLSGASRAPTLLFV
ncbi:hypothetical protein LIER_03249 [Lithospermum erythrorhizon]|uniref:RING-type domain-containing protein n=1 Tax=Lithospermum erythrorhizon TaxID=34254 RepID=A0AAV3NTZ2_LITER